MPIQEFDAKTEYKVKPALPHSLAHKPVYAMPYWHFDGMHKRNTDAKYLSVGLSQWGDTDLSLKIMRHDKQWSPQSEELPLHRVIDSALFLAKVLLDRENQSVEIERNLFVDQKNGFLVMQESVTSSEQDRFDNFLEKYDGDLKARFDTLYQLLSSLKTQGKF